MDQDFDDGFDDFDIDAHFEGMSNAEKGKEDEIVLNIDNIPDVLPDDEMNVKTTATNVKRKKIANYSSHSFKPSDKPTYSRHKVTVSSQNDNIKAAISLKQNNIQVKPLKQVSQILYSEHSMFSIDTLKESVVTFGIKDNIYVTTGERQMIWSILLQRHVLDYKLYEKYMKPSPNAEEYSSKITISKYNDKSKLMRVVCALTNYFNERYHTVNIPYVIEIVNVFLSQMDELPAFFCSMRLFEMKQTISDEKIWMKWFKKEGKRENREII